MKKIVFYFSLLFVLNACKKTDLIQEEDIDFAEFNANSNEMLPGSLLIITSSKKIKKDTASVLFGSTTATFYKLDSLSMGMLVPVIPAGSYILNFKNLGGQDSFSIRVLPYNKINEPRSILTDLQKNAGELMDTLDQFRPQLPETSLQIKFLQELKNRIESKISGLETEEAELMAYFSKQLEVNNHSFTIPTLDTSLNLALANPDEQLLKLVDVLIPIHRDINQLSTLNLQIAELWHRKESDLLELSYLLSLQHYILQKSRAIILNKQISSFPCVTEGSLKVKDTGTTITSPLTVIRDRHINQTIQVQFRTINNSDDLLFNGKVGELYNLNNELVQSDLLVNRFLNAFQSKYNDLKTTIPTAFHTYKNLLPVTSLYKIIEVPASAVIISRVSDPRINVNVSANTDGSLRLNFTSNANTVPDGTKFSFRLNYNQSFSQRSASLSQELNFENYPNISIGGKIWMQENSSVKNFKNGDPIPYVSWGPTWATLKTPAWCYYNNDPASEAIYGLLYNWYALNDPRGFAPEGWHVATDTEWKDLITFLGGNTVAGGKLKSVSPLWNAPNTGATNSSGFSALPAGSRGNGGTYVNLGRSTAWWTANQYGPNGSWSYYAGHNTSSVTRGGASKQDGYSVRCVKD